MRELSPADQHEMLFTVHRSTKPFTGTPMDQTIEQTVNRACKTAGGINKVSNNPGQ